MKRSWSRGGVDGGNYDNYDNSHRIIWFPHSEPEIKERCENSTKLH